MFNFEKTNIQFQNYKLNEVAIELLKSNSVNWAYELFSPYIPFRK